MQINDWPTFGCKVGQSVKIGMKLEPDVWHHPLDVVVVVVVVVNFISNRTNKNKHYNNILQWTQKIHNLNHHDSISYWYL